MLENIFYKPITRVLVNIYVNIILKSMQTNIQRRNCWSITKHAWAEAHALTDTHTHARTHKSRRLFVRKSPKEY